INFSYRIGKMNVDARPRRSRKSINNDDLKDGGGGDNGGGMEGGGGAAAGGGQRNTNAGSAKPTASTLPKADSAAVVKAEGSWNYTVESPQGGAGDLVIKKENGSYTGYITSKRNNNETPLSSVNVNGNELSFQYEMTGQGGNQMVIKVRSIVTGDELAGDMSVGTFGTFPIKGKRAQ
ncbi:MAG: hypothetical protein ABIS36_13530, partial [Chryseolinea sp.]